MILKRLLVSCVAVAMTVSLVPAVAFAKELDNAAVDAVPALLNTDAGSAGQGGSATQEEGKCGAKLDYKLDVGTGTLYIYGSGSMWNWGSKKSPFYAMKDKIKKISIKGATSIGNYAFQGLKNVTSVSIPSSVKTIGSYAFYGSGLKKVSGGSKVKSIGTRAFSLCTKLTSFTITSKYLKKIGTSCFSSASRLKTINIKKTTKLTKSGVKKSLKGSRIKTVKVKKSKKLRYTIYFLKKNSGKKVRVKS